MGRRWPRLVCLLLTAVLAMPAEIHRAAAAQEAGKAFLDQLKARRDTDALVGKALQMALTAAGGKS